jgi:ABC-type amino acid transport substrate-binding protein
MHSGARKVVFKPMRFMALALLAIVASLALDAVARPLAEIKSRGAISICANPNALPHASNKPDTPGFQVEIGRALAQNMGLQLQVEWMSRRMRSDCRLYPPDTIALPEARGPRTRLSQPYQKSGVALGLAKGVDGIRGFGDLKPGQRVGVMSNSVASVILGKQGLSTVPYAFEDEMVADLAKGDLQAVACSPASVAYYMHLHPEAGLSLVHAYDSEPELRWNLALGLRRADDALAEAVNQALDHLVGDGTIKAIYAKYGVEYRHP